MSGKEATAKITAGMAVIDLVDYEQRMEKLKNLKREIEGKQVEMNILHFSSPDPYDRSRPRFMTDSEALSAMAETYNENLDSLYKKITSLSETIESLETDVRELRSTVKSKDKDISKLKEAISSAAKTLEVFNGGDT